MPDSFELQLRADVRRWQQDFRQAAMVLYVQHVAETAEDHGTPDAREIERMSAFTRQIADALTKSALRIVHNQLAAYCRWLKQNGHEPAADALWERHLPDHEIMDRTTPNTTFSSASLGGEPDGA